MSFFRKLDRRPREKVMDARTAEEKIYVASQTQLMWWKFRKHKMAIVSGILVLVLYLMAIFADFVAPYDPNETDTEFLFVARRLGYRVHEVPVGWNYEDTRRVNLARDAWHGARDLARIAVTDIGGGYPAPSTVRDGPAS